MSVFKDKRTGNLFVQFAYKKQTFKQYLPAGSSRTDANKLETKMRSDAFFQAMGMAPKDEILFEDFVQETFLPRVLSEQGKEAFDRAELICIAAKPFLKGKTMRSIKASDIERVKIFRTELKVQRKYQKKPPTVRKPATVCREIAILSKMFSMAVLDDLCDFNPCSRIQKPKFDNMQDKVLRYEDDDAFFSSFDPIQGTLARDVCLLVLNTGLSQKDVLNLDPFKITLRDRMLIVTRSKTVRRVEIPLNSTAYQICKDRLTGGPLFVSRTGKIPLSVKTAMAGACRRAGIERLTIRDLRRTFATRLIESGADAVTVARLLGHAGLRMIPRYVRSVDSMRKAVELLEKNAPTLREQKLRIAKG